MMLQLYFWALATGVAWCLVGVVYGIAPSEKKAFASFYLAYSLLFMASSVLSLQPQQAAAVDIIKVAAFIVPMALINMIGFIFLKRAMETGSQGIAWCITQSAVVIPFLGSTFFLGSESGIFQWSGILLLAVSLGILGKAKNTTEVKTQKGYWKDVALAFLLIGFSQFLQLFPGHIGCSQAALSWRIFFSMPSTVIWWAVVCAQQKTFLLKSVWKLALVYAVVVLLGQVLFYKAVDVGDACRMTAVVFPIAIGACILLFTLYCAIFRREKLSWRSACGILLNVAGIILLSVK